MSCAVTRDELWTWLHDPDDIDADRIAAHVSTCGDCARRVDEMRSLLGDLADLPQSAPAAPTMPDRIGDYRILRRIGEGAMGLVFEAEQQTPQRVVALKVIRGGALADDFRARLFRREMQTLARLNHPAIAAIYDAGVTPDGQCYFAMERVEGIPLNAYVEGRHPGGSVAPLPVRARLELFHRICGAINYAHQRGVIHRDLKPANILVDAAGNPKVLDFGLARATEAEGHAASMVSEAGRLLGTPAYMSPEQTRANPDEIDVRSDVYTLGVILYELTTGAFPYDVTSPTLLEVVQTICEVAPRSPRADNRHLPPDVATITLKALEKDPARRYQTVAELEDDLHRYLNRYPIKARPPSLAYRVSRYVSRHKLPVALFSLILAISVTAAIVFGVLYDRAQREADKFARINEILTTMMQASDPWRSGSKETRVHEILDGMSRRIADELDDTPLVAAALRHTLGRTYWSLGLFDKADDQFRFVRQTRTRLLGARHPETIRATNDLGELLYIRGQVDDAETLLREALERRRRALRDDHPLIGETLNSLGLVRKTQGDFGEAETLYAEALRIRQAAAAATITRALPRHQQADAHDALAQTRNNLGALYRARAEQSDDPDEARALRDKAEVHYLAALRLRREWLGREHLEVAKVLNNYAKLLIGLDRPADAEMHLREALAMLERGLGPDDKYTARTMYNLAEVLAGDPRRHAEAEQLCRDALAAQVRLDPDHPHARASQDLLDRLTRAFDDGDTP